MRLPGSPTACCGNWAAWKVSVGHVTGFRGLLVCSIEAASSGLSLSDIQQSYGHVFNKRQPVTSEASCFDSSNACIFAHATRPGHRPRHHRLNITLQAARATPSSSPRSQVRGSAMRAVSQATNRCTVADLCLGPNQSPTASLPSLHSGQRQGGMGAHQVVLPPQRAGGGTRSPISKL